MGRRPQRLHSQYILASRQAATKLQRIIIGAVAAAFVIAIGLAVYAFIQKNRAQEQTNLATQRQQESEVATQEAKRQEGIAKQQTLEAQREAAAARAREFIATSILAENADPELSVLSAALSVAATWPVGRAVLPEAEQQLHRTIMASHIQLTLPCHGLGVHSVA
jgi:uncharacterized protein HemX